MFHITVSVLREKSPWLYKAILPYLPAVHEDKITMDKELPENIRRALFDPKGKESQALEGAYFQELNERITKETTEKGKREQDRKAAHARYDQYIAEGLVDSERNANLILQFSKEKANGLMNAQVVDLAISNLGPRGTNQLKRGAPQPAATTPTPQEPVQEFLPNGEPQLPLDASESAMRRASVTQLHDLAKRQQASRKLQNRQGWKGAAF